MSKLLSNQKIINELNSIKKDYINTRPEMLFNEFTSNKAERDYNLGDNRRGGYKTFGQHPHYGTSVQTLYPDPLYGGVTYTNYLEFNNRNTMGGMLKSRVPLNGGYHSDSSSEYSSSDSESEYETESESDYDSESDYEGGDIMNDYIKPAGKALYNVGSEVFKDVIVPVGKELIKDAIIGLMTGAGMKGGKITGLKDEYIYIMKKINPDLNVKELNKKTKKTLSRELYEILKLGLHPDDLKTLHLLDKKHKEVKDKGGLRGNKKELKAILKAVYPDIDFDKMDKKEIILKIKEMKQDVPDYGRKRKPKKQDVKVEEILEIQEPIIEKLIKQNKKQGRPKIDKPPKEPKKRGRPKIDKPPKEPKKRGRKPNEEKSKIQKLLKTDKEINKMFKDTLASMKENKKKDKEFKKLLTSQNKLMKKGIKKEKGIKKVVGHKLGERVRGDVVAEYMKKHNVGLGEASKKVKELGLY